MDAFMKDVLNVKPVLLKQNAPEMDAFQQRLLNSQRETYFLLKPDAPKTNAFHVKDVVNIEPFLFDTMPFFTFADDAPQHFKQPDRSLHPASASIANPR